MVYDLNATKIDAVIARCSTNSPLIAEQRNARNSLTRTLRGSDDRTRIVTLGKNDVLGSGTCALANSFENVHVCYFQFSISRLSFLICFAYQMTKEKRKMTNGKRPRLCRRMHVRTKPAEPDGEFTVFHSQHGGSVRAFDD
jgi:hypothetical protein